MFEKLPYFLMIFSLFYFQWKFGSIESKTPLELIFCFLNAILIAFCVSKISDDE